MAEDNSVVEEEKKEKPFTPDDCPKCEECPPCKSGAPAWMATFADMATLLMAFFVLILSFAEMNVPKFKQINGSLKNAFGIQRLIPVVESPKAQSIVARHFSPSIAEPTPLKTIRQETTDDRKEEPEIKTDVSPQAQDALEKMKKALSQEIANGQVEVNISDGKVQVSINETPSPKGQSSNIGGLSEKGENSGGAAKTGDHQAGAATQGESQSGSATTGKKSSGMVSQGEIEFFSKVAQVQATTAASIEVKDNRRAGDNKIADGIGVGGEKEATSQFNKIRENLAKQIKEGKAEVERDGARIIIRLAEQGSFVSGSADLQPSFSDTLRDVSKAIESAKGRIYVEGHTDNVPVIANAKFKSNWDLSGARSGAVADFLTAKSNIPSQRVSVSGHADTRPIEDNKTEKGRARNRRIEVIVDGAK